MKTLGKEENAILPSKISMLFIFFFLDPKDTDMSVVGLLCVIVSNFIIAII